MSECPELYLTQWRILRTDSVTLHIVGCETLGESRRVSSAIKSIDCIARSVETASGRIYKLIGPSGFYPDAAELTWAR
jgi:hypothetical protein